jgi:hypothetical protein
LKKAPPAENKGVARARDLGRDRPTEMQQFQCRVILSGPEKRRETYQSVAHFKMEILNRVFWSRRLVDDR